MTTLQSITKQPTALSDLHEVVDSSQQLCVDRKSAVEFVSRSCNQSHGKLPLEHQHGTPGIQGMNAKEEYKVVITVKKNRLQSLT